MAESADERGAEQPDYTAERDRCAQSLREFVRHAWRHVEPRQLVWGWHLDAMVEALEAVTRGDIRKLMIQVPPGSSKTLMVQVFWPAWEWICDQHPRTATCPDGYRPDLRMIFATYSDAIAKEKSVLCRKLLESDWYRLLFAGRWQPHPDRWGAAMLTNLQGGWRLATSVGGLATGMHADRKVCDDPVKPQEVLTGTASAHKVALDNAWVWWTQTMGLRDTGPETAEVVVMQRLHQADLAGRLMDEGGHEVLCIPQQFEPSHPHVRPLVMKRDGNGQPVRVWTDPRTEPGELMCPARFDANACEERKRTLGPQGYAAQEQQRPVAAGGGIYKRSDFRHWLIRPHGGTWIISADCTFKDASTSDWVVLQVWCAFGPDFFLIDQVRARLDVLGTCSAILTLRGKWHEVREILIEDKANGPAVVSILSRTVPGVVPVTPLGGKEARANATGYYHRSGNVYLPAAENAPWVHDYIEEHTSFPFAAHDDQVDAQSQAVTHLASEVRQFDSILAGMKQMGF